MSRLSISATQTDWSVRDLDTGKLLRGSKADAPKDILRFIESLSGWKDSTLKSKLFCAATVTIFDEHPLSKWVKSMHQSALIPPHKLSR